MQAFQLCMCPLNHTPPPGKRPAGKQRLFTYLGGVWGQITGAETPKEKPDQTKLKKTTYVDDLRKKNL